MRSAALLALLSAVLPLAAQQPAPAPPALSSHQLNPDHTLTFHYRNPGAAKVDLVLEGQPKPLPMTKADDGTWTVTTPALTPEFYGYRFQVDGSPSLDPTNNDIRHNSHTMWNNLLVPGDTPQPWESTDIPHGVLHRHFLTSHVAQGFERNQTRYVVYTPPGYDARRRQPYPVLYLFHGANENELLWSETGHANDILDSLIAAGKARPMLIVMPYGYGDLTFLRGGNPFGQVPRVSRNTELFSEELLTEIIPAIERDYNAGRDRQDRAIAGLSMGGLESLTIGLNHTDRFAYVAGLSSAVRTEALAQQLGTLTPAFTPKGADLRLLWIACGTEDSLLPANRQFIQWLRSKDFQPTAVETPGAHTWLVWRDNLIHLAPLLFTSR